MGEYCDTQHTTIKTSGWTIVVVAAILGILSTAVVATRMWLRIRVQRNVDSSDWIMVVALIFTVAYIIEVCIAEKVQDFDHHICDLSPQQVVILMKASINTLKTIH